MISSLKVLLFLKGEKSNVALSNSCYSPNCVQIKEETYHDVFVRHDGYCKLRDPAWRFLLEQM